MSGLWSSLLYRCNVLYEVLSKLQTRCPSGICDSRRKIVQRKNERAFPEPVPDLVGRVDNLSAARRLRRARVLKDEFDRLLSNSPSIPFAFRQQVSG